MNNAVTQQLNNLPKEILALPRFLRTRKDNPKRPVAADWQNPKRQKLYSDLNGTRGFVAATEQAGGLVMFDFDHCLDGNGNFVSGDAERWFNFLRAEEYFAEVSASGTGIHVFALPTAGKFGKTNKRLYFSENAFLEVFYGATRFCLCTGNTFRCDPQAPIATDEVADDMLATILREIELRTPSKEQEMTARDNHSANPAFDEFRVGRMLFAINPAALDFNEWLTVLSCCFNLNVAYTTFDQWCRLDMGTNAKGKPRYDAKENYEHWASRINPEFGFGQLYNLAARFGYDAKATAKEWFDMHPELSTKRTTSTEQSPADENAFDSEQEKTAEDSAVRTADKIKSCPINLRVPRDFEFSLRGITYIEPPRKEGKPPRRIDVSLTPCVVTRNFVDPVTFKTRCEVAAFIRNTWRTLEFSARTLADPRAAFELTEYGVKVLDAKLLCRFFAELVTENPDIAEIKAYNQTGWVDDDCTEFASPNSEDYVIRREGIDYRKIFTPKGDADAWKQKFVEVMEYGGAPMRIMMGTAAASFLLAPLEISFNLRLHCWGQRSIGKTAAQSFCVSAFGDASKKGLIVPYGGSTPKGRYEIATAFNDIPLVGEEIESLQKRDAEKLSDEKYNFFSGTSGKVLHKEGGLRAPKYFRSAILTNGEHPASDATANGGELKREVSIHCPTLLPENFAADLYPFIAKNHGLFLDAWTQYIAKNKDFIAKQYHQALTLAQQGHSAADSTQLTMLVIAAVAYQHFKLCLKLTDLAADADAINAEMGSDIDDIVARLPTAAEIDDTTRAIEYLRDFVAANDKFFAHEVHKPEYDNEFTQQAMTCYGKIFKNGEVAFIPSELTKILETKFKSADKLIAEFADRGKLRTVHGLNTFPTKIKGKSNRAIRFVAGILADAESDSDDDETTA